jgi:hypothetical protein
MRLQAFSAVLSTTVTVVRIPSRRAIFADSCILGAGITGKNPFNTQ